MYTQEQAMGGQGNLWAPLPQVGRSPEDAIKEWYDSQILEQSS